MEELLDFPTRNPSNFSHAALKRVLRKDKEPRHYVATHERTEAPSGQVINTDQTSFLIRQFAKLGLELQQRRASKRNTNGTVRLQEINRAKRPCTTGPRMATSGNPMDLS